MKQIIITACLMAFGLAAPLTLSAAHADDATGTVATGHFNSTCPMCDKPASATVKPVAMKVSDETKKKHPGIETAMVGCCGDACRAGYEKDAAKFESKLAAEWQEWKNQSVKSIARAMIATWFAK